MKTSEPQSSLFSVLFSSRFWGFFGAQFLGALNDNLAKNTLVALLAFQATAFGGLNPNTISNTAAALFILPFFIASAFCGMLADKFERRTIALWVKVLEIGIQCLVLLGFYWTNVWILLACIFLLGLHSTLFGPVKGALIPSLVPQHQIVAANGLISGATFAAILIGTLSGGLFGTLGIEGGIYVGYLGIGLAFLGLFFAYKMPSTPPSCPDLALDYSFWKQTRQALLCAREPISVWRSIFGISWFWFFGLTLLTQFPVYAKDVLGTDPTGLTTLLALFSLGVALGSFSCNRLSCGRVEIGLVPLGSIGMSLCAFALFAFTPAQPLGSNLSGLELLMLPQAWMPLTSLFGLAFFGGLFIVPLYALIQTRAPEHLRARVIAANNILNSGFMVASAFISILILNVAGASIAQLIALLALMNLVVAVYIYQTVPEFLLRFCAWILTHSIYRMRVHGTEHLPEQGAALLVCNHVSFADAFILMGSISRPVKFVMDWRIYQTRTLHWLFKDAKTIPIASAQDNPQLLQEAFSQIQKHLQEGELVLIFPEGKITHDGAMQPFKNGMRTILDTTAVPVHVLTLSGLWGSFFSRKYGKAMRRPFVRPLFEPVHLDISPAQPTHISAQQAAHICQQQQRAP